ncbi:hypothetical protein TYRP_006910 [Tyrophagus putrescentiae]|nr:hypothetical protein TYRP_006910 [Tyrophagus putrescentiae]
MSSLIWSSPSSPSPHYPHHLVPSPQLLLLLCAIITTLITPNTHGQLLYSPPSSPIHYKPVISMAVPPAAAQVHVHSTVQRMDTGPHLLIRIIIFFFFLLLSPASASLNSVYTAINPVLGTNKYGTAAPVSAADTAPSSATASASASATASTGSSVNSTSNGYLFSESIARNSYQKMPSQQSTYMIQPAKYRAAFSSTRNTTPTTTTNSTSSNKTTSANKSATLVRSPKSSSKSSKIINSEVMPIPLIKPHRHGATLGFNLPDQGLTLYLDINELATKPMAQNIGLKVVSHAKSGDDLELEEVREELNEVKPAKSNKVLRKRVTKVLKKQGKDGKTVTIVTGAAKSSTREGKSSRLQGTNVPTTTTLPPLPGSTKRIKLKTENHFLSPANKAKQQQQQQQQNQVIEIPSLNHQVDINSEKIFADLDKQQQQGGNNLTRNDIPPTASRIPSTYVSQRKEGESEPSPPSPSTTNILGGGIDDDLPDLIKEAGPGAEPPSEEPIVKEEESGEATGENETDSDNVERSVNAEDAAAAEELEEAIEEENERVDGSLGASKSATPPSPQLLNSSSQARQQEAVDNKFVSQMQSLLEKSAQLVDISAQTCSAAVSRCQRGGRL